jgi:hypothetical protein
LPIGQLSAAGHAVSGIYCSCVISDPYLSGAGMDLGEVVDLQNFRATITRKSYCTHFITSQLA